MPLRETFSGPDGRFIKGFACKSTEITKGYKVKSMKNCYFIQCISYIKLSTHVFTS